MRNAKRNAQRLVKCAMQGSCETEAGANFRLVLAGSGEEDREDDEEIAQDIVLKSTLEH